MEIINKLNSTRNIWTIIPELTAKELEEVIKLANYSYYNTSEELISDSIYDFLVERLKLVKPNSKILKLIGSDKAYEHGEKIKLPYWMGSMNKIKNDEEQLNKWINKFSGPYIISYKIDGISALYTKKNGIEKLYTRGKGNEGADITHLLKYCNMNLDNVPNDSVIRGEMVMSKKNFEKYIEKFSNARAMVSGIVNSKEESLNKIHAKKIDFITFEVIEPKNLNSLEQFKLLKKWNTKHTIYYNHNEITIKLLNKILSKGKEEYDYDIDGIVITDNDKHSRNISGNPEYSVAYKGMTNSKDTEVIDVIWTPSKDGYLIPRIHYKKVKLSGVEMDYTTGFNAAYIYNNNIGPGAIITIIRSGDVIPYIIDVPNPAEEPGMPEDYDYYWDKNEVHIIVNDKDDNEKVKIKLITKFLKDINVSNISEGLITRLVENGYDDIFKILKMDYEDFLELDGFQEKLAEKIYNNIHSKLHNIDILKLMVASNLLGRGFGEKKIKKILEEYPDIIDDYDKSEFESWKESIIEIDGFDELTATKFLENIYDFRKFYKKISKLTKINPYKSKINKSGHFQNQIIVFTGFKNPQWKEIIESEGGKVTESVSGKTTLLVHDNDTIGTSKYVKAEKLGIKIMSKSKFEKVIGKLIK